jgi:hypothetical protein
LDYSQQVDRYVFHKPLWRKVLPFFLLLLVWLLPAFLWKGHELKLPEPFNTWPTLVLDWLAQAGIRLEPAFMVAAAISVVVVIWWYKAFEVLIISADAITRSSLLGFRNTLRWVDVDEVLIDHLEARMEGDVTARKTLYLYEVPKGIFGMRRRMKINNRQFDGFDDVERIAVLVSVPAVAERLRQRVDQFKKPATFAVLEPGELFMGLLALIAGLGIIAAAFYEPVWVLADIPYVWAVRPGVIVLGVVLFLIGIFRFFYQQIGVDGENVYIMRYRWVMKRIPIDTIADIQIRENQMRIYAFVKDPEIPKQVYKTNKYVRNRGVMLRLIREIYDIRRNMDNTPIPGIQSIPMGEKPIA